MKTPLFLLLGVIGWIGSTAAIVLDVMKSIGVAEAAQFAWWQIAVAVPTFLGLYQ